MRRYTFPKCDCCEEFGIYFSNNDNGDTITICRNCMKSSDGDDDG